MTEQQLIQFKKTTYLPNGLSVAETECRMNERIADLYVELWERGLTPKYRDARCKSDKEIIRANADGSEDLLLFNSNDKTYTLLRQLSPEGQGRLTALTERIRRPVANV